MVADKYNNTQKCHAAGRDIDAIFYWSTAGTLRRGEIKIIFASFNSAVNTISSSNLSVV
jgi:hypothetical protein